MRTPLFVASLLCLLVSGTAAAQQADDEDVPAFDRPGLGLGTGIVPRGAMALELGLPSYTRDTDRDGVRSEQFDSEVTLRTGLAPRLELQLSGSPWQRERTRAPTEPSLRERGTGDTHAALKWLAPLRTESDRLAVLASATLARGDAAFSEGRQYALAGSWEHDFTDDLTSDLYVSHSRGDGQRATVWSPSLSLALGPRWSAFIEAGFTHTRGEPNESVAGGGVTFLWSERIQLDASLDAGLDADSPDLQAGVGLAVYFD